MCSVKLTILEARCRAGIHAEGQEYLVDGTCPPMCHELWQCIYPQVYALQNGGNLDSDVYHQSLIDSGYSQALIQKQDATIVDESSGDVDQEYSQVVA